MVVTPQLSSNNCNFLSLIRPSCTRISIRAVRVGDCSWLLFSFLFQHCFVDFNFSYISSLKCIRRAVLIALIIFHLTSYGNDRMVRS